MACSDDAAISPRDRRPTPADVERAAHQLLDLVKRPGGGLRGFHIPPSPDADRALLALFDAVERNP